LEQKKDAHGNQDSSPNPSTSTAGGARLAPFLEALASLRTPTIPVRPGIVSWRVVGLVILVHFSHLLVMKSSFSIYINGF
jgi:hypothetical protein